MKIVLLNFVFFVFIQVSSTSKPSSYDPIVITRNLAESLNIPLADSEEIIKMTKDMRTKTSKELYNWLNKKIGDTNDFRKFLSKASSDTIRIRHQTDTVLSSQTSRIREAWLEFRKQAKFLASGKGHNQIRTYFDRLLPHEKNEITKIFNHLYGFNFTENQLYRMLH